MTNTAGGKATVVTTELATPAPAELPTIRAQLNKLALIVRHVEQLNPPSLRWLRSIIDERLEGTTR